MQLCSQHKSLSALWSANDQALTQTKTLKCLPSCEINVAILAVQELQHTRTAAEARIAAITGERDASREECAQLRLKLNAMQEDLQSAQGTWTDHQGCRDPARQLPGQGCEGQPSGMGDVPLTSGAVEEKAGNSAVHLPATHDCVDSVPQFNLCCCCNIGLTLESKRKLSRQLSLQVPMMCRSL